MRMAPSGELSSMGAMILYTPCTCSHMGLKLSCDVCVCVCVCVCERETDQIRVAEWLGTVTLIWEVCGSIPRNGGFFL